MYFNPLQPCGTRVRDQGLTHTPLANFLECLLAYNQGLSEGVFRYGDTFSEDVLLSLASLGLENSIKFMFRWHCCGTDLT